MEKACKLLLNAPGGFEVFNFLSRTADGIKELASQSPDHRNRLSDLGLIREDDKTIFDSRSIGRRLSSRLLGELASRTYRADQTQADEKQARRIVKEYPGLFGSVTADQLREHWGDPQLFDRWILNRSLRFDKPRDWGRRVLAILAEAGSLDVLYKRVSQSKGEDVPSVYSGVLETAFKAGPFAFEFFLKHSPQSLPPIVKLRISEHILAHLLEGSVHFNINKILNTSPQELDRVALASIKVLCQNICNWRVASSDENHHYSKAAIDWLRLARVEDRAQWKDVNLYAKRDGISEQLQDQGAGLKQMLVRNRFVPDNIFAQYDHLE